MIAVMMGAQRRQQWPVALLAQVEIVCEDCGRTKLMGPRDLRLSKVSPDVKFSDWASRLRCSCCRFQGGFGNNVAVHPLWRG